MSKPAIAYKKGSGKPYYPKPADFVPDPTYPKDHAWYGQKRCQAWNYRTGEQCMLKPSKGKRVCYKDGGKTPSGLDSPHYKGKGMSRYMPARLAERFNEFINDPQLVTSKNEIAMIDVRLSELYQSIDVGASKERFGALQGVHVEVMKAIEKRDVNKVAKLLGDMGALLDAQRKDNSVWFEVMRLATTKGRLVNNERRYEMSKYQAITYDRLMLLVGGLVTIIRTIVNKYVKDKKLAQQIFADIGKEMRALLDDSGGLKTDD